MTEQTYTISKTAELLGLARSSTYEAARRGEIPTIRIGKLILFQVVELERMLAEAKTKTSNE